MKDIFNDKKINIVGVSFSVIQYISTFLTSGIILALALGSALNDLGKVSLDDFINKYAIYLFIIPLVYFVTSLFVYLVGVKFFIYSKENLKKYILIAFITQILITLILAFFNSNEVRNYILQLIISIIENLIIFGLVYIMGKNLVNKKAA